ncbi:hypothetical protein DAETH_05080 [Deinococcus aetherius]|uniref:Colicin V production protein n=1 Tax=Deinococcus aetherius TaxID=200252 RepID=A0ABM8A9V6_9DEIO|nr:hypothetical protein [Deinococcus aetherius]BDP40539.1 hypothetical protein DAETH_05080 [Deinococcus aetherius]
MITWFDALLVTLWAAMTALGARRGLAGLVWGLGGVAVCFLANMLGRGTVAATLLALGLGVGLALAARRLVPEPVSRPWHSLAGALGGGVFGAVLVATLALGFPLEVRVGPQGREGVYPAPHLPPSLYAAVRGSTLKEGLMDVWHSGAALRTLLMPDQVHGPR